MKYMVEFSLQPGRASKAVELFETRGPNRNPGVTFRSAWIGAESDLIFALVESGDESHVAAAAQTWSESDEYRITRVIDIEQF